MPVLYQRPIITIEDTIAHRDWVFLFGDNSLRKGRGGQAIIRGQPNAHGIRTKHLPSMHSTAFLRDDEFRANCEMIDTDLLYPFACLAKGKTVVIPAKIGHGLAMLDVKAPLTCAYLVARLDSLVSFAETLNQSQR